MAGTVFSKNRRVLLSGHSEGDRPASWLGRFGITAYEASLRTPRKVAV